MTGDFDPGSDGADDGVTLVGRKNEEAIFSCGNVIECHFTSGVDVFECDDLHSGILQTNVKLLRLRLPGGQPYCEFHGRAWYALRDVQVLTIFNEAHFAGLLGWSRAGTLHAH